MLIHIPTVLDAAQLADCRDTLAAAEWIDGRVTAGHQSERVKDNRQVPERHPIARRLGDMILTALERNPLFLSAALPLKIVPPLFNRYEGGQNYGNHVDGAIRPITGTPFRVRTDLSITVFISPPDTYEGGELIVDDSGGHRIKLPAGDAILYPGTSVHRVAPVTRGVRLASFFWIESMVRADSQRTLLFDLDTAIQQLAAAQPDNPPVLQLINVYHNLLRHWADT
ncbi:MAG TPA: Fe2+-dependent dioxygenase [Stellaceae bacterium]|jgi:PKHD-type hydroxylase|nr:Fe2+-dependent dioxygenase [Stellaceae bacterium]